MKIGWMLLMASVAAVGQTAPKSKKFPVYQVKMVCPKGQTLYAEYQTGMKALGGNMIQMIFEWIPWDGYTQIIGGGRTACFKTAPPAASLKQEPR